MSRLWFAGVAAAVLAGLLLAVAVGVMERAPALAAHVVEVTKDGDQIDVKVEVLNRSSYGYSLSPPVLELRQGRAWKPFPAGLARFSQNALVPVEAVTLTRCAINPLPQGTRLRLVIAGHRPKRGLASFLFRLKLRFSEHARGVSLNPFDPTPIICPDTVAITEEFAAP